MTRWLLEPDPCLIATFFDGYVDRHSHILLHCPKMTFEQFFWIFFISALPVIELRGAIPAAILQGELPRYFASLIPSTLIENEIKWYYALPVAYAGNLFPVPFILKFLDPVVGFISKVRILDSIVQWVFRRTRRQGRLVEKYELIGLVLVVAIPLPGTGAWTGAILAFLLGLEFKRAFLSIVLGVFIAGVIVTTLSLLGWAGAVIAGICLITLVALGLWRV